MTTDTQTILGANGTIGSLLARELTRYTSSIRLVSRNPRKVNPTDELFAADLSEPATVDRAVEGSKIVYLLVGFEYKLSTWRKKWPALMRATLDACKRHNSKLVFFDNMYLYDAGSLSHMTESTPIDPPSEKGKVREQIARMLMDDVAEGKVSALIARSADFYGPENKSSLLIELVYKNLKKNRRPNWLIDIDRKHSFTYTPDAARATAILGNSDEAYNQVWHLPTDSNTPTVREMINLFAKEMNVKAHPMVLSRLMIKLASVFVPVMREMLEMSYQYDRDTVFISKKFEQKFGMHATPYQEGVRQIVRG